VWGTIQAVARIAFPIALLATVVFAVLFACCTMLTNDGETALSVCTFVRAICAPQLDPIKFIADVSKLDSVAFREALTKVKMQQLLNVSGHGINPAKILSAITFPEELKKGEFLPAAFMGNVDVATDDVTWTEMLWGWAGWYSPKAGAAIREQAKKVNTRYLTAIQRLYEVHMGHLDKEVAATDSAVQEYLSRLNSGDNSIDSFFNNAAHRQFVADMHKFAWQQFTPLASVFGRAQGGALRLVGDALGLNDNFADKAAGWGAALVALAALAGFYLGPAAAAGVLATTAAFYAGYDLTGEPTTAVGLAVTVMGYCRSFVPTTSSEDHALDSATQLAMGISSAMQTQIDATREAERKAKLAQAEMKATLVESGASVIGALGGVPGVALGNMVGKGAGGLVRATAAHNANQLHGTAALLANMGRPNI
jgi:hypothetical protein